MCDPLPGKHSTEQTIYINYKRCVRIADVLAGVAGFEPTNDGVRGAFETENKVKKGKNELILAHFL